MSTQVHGTPDRSRHRYWSLSLFHRSSILCLRYCSAGQSLVENGPLGGLCLPSASLRWASILIHASKRPRDVALQYEKTQGLAAWGTRCAGDSSIDLSDSKPRSNKVVQCPSRSQTGSLISNSCRLEARSPLHVLTATSTCLSSWRFRRSID